MLAYALQYYGKLLEALGEHIGLLFGGLGLGVLCSGALVFLMYRFRCLRTPVMVLLQILYTVPSLAFFALLIPFTGLGMRTAVIVLSAYSLFFLVRSFVDGMDGLDGRIVEAGEAMGYTPWQLFYQIQLPLCLPSMVSGIRVASISTVGISCIAYTVGAGGIGSVLFEGMRQLSYVKILWGALLAVFLSTVLHLSLMRLERHCQQRLHLEG